MLVRPLTGQARKLIRIARGVPVVAELVYINRYPVEPWLMND
jgi:hypothetical protein